MPLASRHKIWKQTIQNQNLEQSPHAETIFNTSNIKILVETTISYAGGTGHYVPPGTLVTYI